MSSPNLSFIKMHGLGNDFVMVDCLDGVPLPIEQMPALSTAVCDRNFGVGADGLILVLPDGNADFRMRMWNPDGSESEMCGNGIRCFGKLLFDKGLVGAGASGASVTGENTISVATTKGLQRIEILAEGAQPGASEIMVRVDMDIPHLKRSEIPMTPIAGGNDAQVINQPLQVGANEYSITGVSMGNPHIVIFVDDVESVALKEIGLEIEHHQTFPERTNVHFVQVLGPQKLWMRTWERGAGDTLACGTGACAVVVASALTDQLKNTERRALVHLPGGDLDVEWAQNNHVYMTGPATTVFEATLHTNFLKNI
jgi:diaminopimelate epimerase